jgi:carboxylate-amine ligase
LVATPQNQNVADRFLPEDAPEWPDGGPPDVAELRALFDSHSQPTVGAEEELMLLDPQTLELSPTIEWVLALFPDDPRFHREVRDSQVEIVTPVSGNALAAGLHIAQARVDLADRLAPDCVIAAGGTHPFSSRWGNVGADDRYQSLAEEYTAGVRGDIPSGLHVHAAVPGADRALAVYNAGRSYLPEIAALAANSPFLGGVDTGLASARRPLTEGFHRAGVPPAFDSWESFVALVDWGRRGGLYPDATHFWWDLRLHPRYGTLELRIADSQTRAEDVVAIAALFHSLCGWLATRWDAGERLAVHDSTRISENAWRAIRYGVRGWMVDLDSGTAVPTRERVARVLDDVAPAAERLGNQDWINTARTLLADNGAERQRYVHSTHGLQGLAAWLAAETTASARDLLTRRA